MTSDGHVTSRQLQAEQTKINIFNAATRLLNHSNIEDIRISDIAKEANVASGTFYRYYKTKWDVFLALYGIIDDHFKKEVGPNLIQPHVNDRILYFFDQYALFHISLGKRFVRLLFNTDNNFLKPADLTLHNDHHGLEILIKTIHQGIDDHQISSSESAVDIVMFLIIAVRGVVFNWCIRDNESDLREDLAYFVTRLLLIYKT